MAALACCGWRAWLAVGAGASLWLGCGPAAGSVRGGGVQRQGDEGGGGGQGDAAAQDHQHRPQRQSRRRHRGRRGWRSGRGFGRRGGCRGGRGHGGQGQQERGEDGQCPAGGGQWPPGVTGTGTRWRVGRLVDHGWSLLVCSGPGGVRRLAGRLSLRAAQRGAVGTPLGLAWRLGWNRRGPVVELEEPPRGVTRVAVTWAVRNGR
jgi:hypothetical protein